jgi:hypothetical protein
MGLLWVMGLTLWVHCFVKGGGYNSVKRSQELSMKSVQRMLGVLVVLYLLYLVKSALGINLSDRYSAWDFLKFPIWDLLHHA